MTPQPDYDHATWRQISARVRVSLLPPPKGGRSGPIWEGYHPNHKLQEGLFCMGAFTSIEGGHIAPGETGEAEITFLMVDELEKWFQPGLVWQITEGGRTVGTGELLAVLSSEAVPAAPPPRRTPAEHAHAAWHKLQVEANISLLPEAEGGRHHPVWENWSPQHVFAGSVHCAGRLTHITGAKIMPGEAGTARIEFSVHEPNRALFKPGATWAIYDRGRRVGTGLVRTARERTASACHWRSRE